MKKLIIAGALGIAGLVYAQEAAVEAETSATPVAPAAACQCQAGEPCTCGEACKCAKPQLPPRGPRPEFRGHRHGPHHGARPPHQMPKFKKCTCCEGCEGVIILPPNSTEGEPLFKLFKKEGECGCGGKPECGCANGPKPGCAGGPECGKGRGPKPGCMPPPPPGFMPPPPPPGFMPPPPPPRQPAAPAAPEAKE